jgi:hypothetical protein
MARNLKILEEAETRALPELICSEAAPQVPDQKIGIVLAHPGDKNKNVARMGHPDMVAIPKAESTSKWLFRQEKAIFRRGKLRAVT